MLSHTQRRQEQTLSFTLVTASLVRGYIMHLDYLNYLKVLYLSVLYIRYERLWYFKVHYLKYITFPKCNCKLHSLISVYFIAAEITFSFYRVPVLDSFSTYSQFLQWGHLKQCPKSKNLVYMSSRSPMRSKMVPRAFKMSLLTFPLAVGHY